MWRTEPHGAEEIQYKTCLYADHDTVPQRQAGVNESYLMEVIENMEILMNKHASELEKEHIR